MSALEGDALKNASRVHAGHRKKNDPPLKEKKPRACCKCGAKFQPTQKRRMLCEYCFRHAW